MKGKVALVTGGSRGIGRAVALELARRGADVAISYLSNASAADSVVEELRGLDVRGLGVPADARDPASAPILVDRVIEVLGRLDILIANAGRVVAAPLLQTTVEDYDTQLETNTRGSFFVIQAAARQMIAQAQGGRIVLITSRSATRAAKNFSAYCISKAGAKMLAKNAAIELAQYGITVNALAPGTVETDLNRDLLADPEMRAALVGPILLGRPGRSSEVAAAAAFLASDQASFITGCSIAVDGGSALA